eukprot:TRINITY_DN11348_c0_g1_i3.p1 TRINITY_DN11348_c0_g1~~TRINITY_DN11348_c0_g1_i3.p1  ORF type:complete len:152 (+),score=11.91 TRINITY_DN11348_c0_g1_i3:143-598(+)
MKSVGAALYMNADTGDIHPSTASCMGMPANGGAPTVADAIAKLNDNNDMSARRIFDNWTQCMMQTRNSSKPSTTMAMITSSVEVPFGPPDLHNTARQVSCSSRDCNGMLQKRLVVHRAPTTCIGCSWHCNACLHSICMPTYRWPFEHLHVV